MKKRLLILVLAVAMFCQMMPTTAFAANDTSAQTKVTYTYTKSDYYEIDIPATLDLNTEQSYKIAANNVVLDGNKAVQVSVDTTSFVDDYFTLKMVTNVAKYMKCELYATAFNPGIEQRVTSANNIIGTFREGDTPDTNWIYLRFSTCPTLNNAAGGEYQGTLYFNISVVSTPAN